MKQLTCEVCGSNELMKQDGVFVCQICGCKFSLDDVRKMMIEGPVEVTGNVHVDNTSKIENFLALAETALDNGDYVQAYDYAKRILEIDSNCTKAWRMEFSACINLEDKFSYTDWITTGKSAIKFSSESEKQSMEELVYSTFIAEAENISTDELETIKDVLRQMVEHEQEVKKTANERVSSDSYVYHLNLVHAHVKVLCAIMDLANISFKSEQSALKLWESVPVDVFKDFKSFREKGKAWLIKCNDFISMYSDTYDSFKKSMNALQMPYSAYENEEAVSKRKAKLQGIYMRIMEAEQISENEHRQKIETYWKEHAKEKEALDEEKASLETKIKDLQTDIMNSKEYKNLKALEKNIRNTETELESLGMLKFKAKRELREELDDLNTQFEQAQREFQDVVALPNQEIKKLNVRVQEIEKELNLEH